MLIYLFLSAYNAVEETLEEEIKAALTAKEKEKPSNRSVAFVGVLGANKLNYYFNTCKLMMLLLIFLDLELFKFGTSPFFATETKNAPLLSAGIWIF